MENEKRKVGEYTVLCAVNIGSREIILAENEQSANGERFLCCYGERNDIFEKFTECAVGDDYICRKKVSPTKTLRSQRRKKALRPSEAPRSAVRLLTGVQQSRQIRSLP